MSFYIDISSPLEQRHLEKKKYCHFLFSVNHFCSKCYDYFLSMLVDSDKQKIFNNSLSGSKMARAPCVVNDVM